MRKHLSLFLAFMMALASLEAEAARMGGGRSVGRQSGNVVRREATPPTTPATPATPGNAAQQNARNANTAAQPAAPNASPAAVAKRPWGAILGGLAAGLGLSWLAHTLGLSAAFGNVLLLILLALVVMVVWRLFSSRSRQPSSPRGNAPLAFQGAGGGPLASAPLQYSPKNVGNDASARPWEQPAFGESEATAASGTGSMIGSALAGAQSWGVPAGFDTEGFLSAAKRNFITLQDAWDRGDVATLRSMMTDEMVGEIRSQLAERESHSGSLDNKTEVVTLDAQLLGIEELPDAYMASVEFAGVIREDASAGPSPFREVWNMTRPRNGGSGWLVAGVQALR